MYKHAARSSCSFEKIQVTRWLPHSFVPFYPLKCEGSPGEKMYLFQFLNTVYAKVVIFNPTNNVFLRSAINALSIEPIKGAHFRSLKIGLECLLLHCSLACVPDPISEHRILQNFLGACPLSIFCLYWNMIFVVCTYTDGQITIAVLSV